MLNELKTLTLNNRAVEILSAAFIEEEWFDSYGTAGSEELKRVECGKNLYILTNDVDIDDHFTSINLEVFQGDNRSVAPEIFTRILRVSSRAKDRSISMPKSWAPFHEGSILSIYAHAAANPGGARLHFDQNADGRGHLYAFSVTEQTVSFSELEIFNAELNGALGNLVDAVLMKNSTAQAEVVGNFGILLSEPLENIFFSPGRLNEWLETKLNPEQMRFVEKSHLEPVRLRGAAGTGKTQAMAVKCLRDLYEDEDEGGDKSFAFLTHSAALAHDVLRAMLHALDPEERWNRLVTHSGHPKLWIGTLYEMAERSLGFSSKGLEPLSLDGREGRFFQEVLINEAIQEVRQEAEARLRLIPGSLTLGSVIDVDEVPDLAIKAIQNEFACVLDAENVRLGTQAGENYLSNTRQSWQMDLPEKSDRELMLLIYESYRRKLRENNVLSMDQLIADYARYLGTHEWEQLKEEQGFDIVFVDEYHYFNRLETMTFQNLFKPRAGHKGRWPVFMAYDLKQSTTDGSLGGGIQRFRNPGIGESEAVDLNKVYRSTPEIGAFLADLDASFPTLDLEGEYEAYRGESQKASGDTPKLLRFDTNIDLIDTITIMAQKAAKEVDGKGREVAILCCNDELFDAYRKAGRIRDRIITVDSREDFKELRYSKSRCVFSMPEYVAGLQFEIVFLIHLDKADLLEENRDLYQWRQHLSRAYLGSTRAKSKLVVACSVERGGPSPAILQPLRNGSLVED